MMNMAATMYWEVAGQLARWLRTAIRMAHFCSCTLVSALKRAGVNSISACALPGMWQQLLNSTVELGRQPGEDVLKVKAGQLVVHSDNGAPMKGETMLATMQRLGVAPSRSRPSVSNDNPYSESLFRTLKYRPAMPVKPFECLFQARRWVTDLVHWYNDEHRHSAIGFVTPNQRHADQDKQLLAGRAVFSNPGMSLKRV